jgi:hypothetical protein
VARDGPIGSREGHGRLLNRGRQGGAQLDSGGVAMPAGGGGERVLFIGAARLRGDDSGTGDAAVVPGLDRRAYGGVPPTDRRSAVRTGPVRRGPWRARAGRIPMASGHSAWGRAGAHDVAAQRRPGPNRFSDH